jgi:hypothetical protein
MRVVVFAGPSLPPRLRPRDDTLWEWRPPVRQGDVYRAALAHPVAIGVVDGYFDSVPTAWHKEFLWAMAEGIHVFGAASIGALRAVELEAFGMRGVGRIFRELRDAPWQDFDEVAVLHGPAELGYPAETEAMVNMRATFDAAIRDGVLTAELAALLTGLAKVLFYHRRTYAAVLRSAAACGCPSAELRRFADWLPGGQIDQKRIDAEAMLEAVRSQLATDPRPLRVTYSVSDTVAWQAARRLSTDDHHRGPAANSGK